jgi:mRNA interferase MazF
MKWGDIILVNLDPIVGSEADKVRPAVVVSNNGANNAITSHGRGVLTVLPITSNVSRVYPFQVLIEDDQELETAGLDKISKIQAEQIRAIDVRRFVRRLGRLRATRTSDLRAALSLHLGL